MRKTRWVLCLLLLAGGAFGQNGEVFVSDAGNFNSPPWQILRFDENGQNPQVFTNQQLGWPQDIVFLQDGTVIVSNLNSGRITRYDADSGAYIDDFATGIGGPTRMRIGADGLLYVLQWQGNGRVWRYQPDGSFVDEFTSTGVSQSIGLDWDSQGNLYVSSFGTASVRKFDSNGNDLGLFINSNLQGPTNIWFAENGDLLVADWSGTAIKRFSSAGVFLGNFAVGLSQSEGIALLDNGHILVGNGATSAVKEFDQDGNFVKDFISSGSGGLIRPNAVVVRPQATSNFVINAGLNDAWVSANAPFQGFFFTVFPDLGLFFLAWFTFDSELPDGDTTATFGASDQRWVTGAGVYSGNNVTVNVELTSGGVFNAAEPQAEQTPGYGTISIEFNNCNEAVLTYDFPTSGLSGQTTLSRVAMDNVALCEALLDLGRN